MLSVISLCAVMLIVVKLSIIMHSIYIQGVVKLHFIMLIVAKLNAIMQYDTGRSRFKKCKQLFEYQHLLLLRNIWQSKF